MDPVTHMLTGAVLARSGLHRRAAYATLTLAIAAEFPDIDTLWSLRGPLTGFQHHRGITHTFLGVPFEAGLVVLLIFLLHRLRRRPSTKAPPNWSLLYLGSLVALLSHLLLDWTNNYGIRPFFPFNPRWYAGSFVFIVEPVLLLLLLAPLVLPPLFSLINAEVGARKRVFVSPVWSVFSLVLIAGLYLLRFNEHSRALVLAAQNAPPEAFRFFASPHPVDPFAWSVIAETPATYQLSTLNTRSGDVGVARPADTLYKPPTSLPLLAAKRSELGRVYLDWSMYPVLSETLDTSDPHHPLHVVTFVDARFLYNAIPGEARRETNAPLKGTVTLDMEAPEGQRVVEIDFDGKKQP